MPFLFLKHGGSWDHVENVFGISGPTFMCLVTGFMKKLEEFIIDRSVYHYNCKCKMEQFVNKGTTFHHFPYSLEAAGTTFQQANRTSGVMEEEKLYYSWNQKLYGSKLKWISGIMIMRLRLLSIMEFL